MEVNSTTSVRASLGCGWCTFHLPWDVHACSCGTRTHTHTCTRVNAHKCAQTLKLLMSKIFFPYVWKYFPECFKWAGMNFIDMWTSDNANISQSHFQRMSIAQKIRVCLGHCQSCHPYLGAPDPSTRLQGGTWGVGRSPALFLLEKLRGRIASGWSDHRLGDLCV